LKLCQAIEEDYDGFLLAKTKQTDALKAGCINKHKLINIAHKKDIPLLKLIITETFYKIHGQ